MRKINIEIKDDLNHYALIKQENGKENETDYGMLIDKDQFEQLRLYFVSGHVPEDIQTFLHRLRLAEHPEIRKEAVALFERHCR